MTNISIFNRASFLAKTYSTKYSYNSGWGLGAWIFWSLIWIGLYVYSALTLMFIAKKTATENSWMAWIPLVNIYLMCKIAGKSVIWIVLLLIPFINIVVIVLLWSAIAERLGRPAWWGILMLIPIANLVIMGILAFSGAPSRTISSSQKSTTISFSKKTNGSVCSKCGIKADASDKFCPECGGKITKPVAKKGSFCPSCGNKTESNVKFCPSCGAKT